MHRLLYGNARSPLATVVPDIRWPGMWRIVWPNGQRSDMVNLSRAIEAAEANAERGPPGRDRKLLRWEMGCLEDGRKAAPVDLNVPDVPSIEPGKQIDSQLPIIPADDRFVRRPSPDGGSP